MVHNLFDLTGRVALVTGAASGLGARFAEVLAQAGATVICSARRQNRIEAVADKIQAAGNKALALPLDVTDSQAVKIALDRIEADIGTVDILVNNAGVDSGDDPIPFTELSEENWDKLMAVNLKAVFMLSQQVTRRMISADKPGSIINIASICGLNAAYGLSDYCVSKAGCVQLTKSMALDLSAHNIRVNAIAPGLFTTEMTGWVDSDDGQQILANIPLKRAADPREMDGTLLLLASDASSFITGSIITVDGGQSAQLVGG